MNIAVTGATGFIGGELVSYLASHGHRVIRLQRRSTIYPDERFFDVRSINSIPDLTGIDALIHTAFVKYDPVNLPDSSEINIKMTLALGKACHRAGTKFVFLSTMSAHAEAISHYGRHKYELEQKLDASRDLIFKLGLVIGHRGLFDSIRSAIAKGAFIPLVGNGTQPIQTIAVNDVCRIIGHAIETDMTGSYVIGTEKVYTLKDLYTVTAQKMNKKPLFIPVPYEAVNLALSTIELLKIPFNVSKENLLGLKQLKAFDTRESLQKLGIAILDMDQALDQIIKEKQ